LKKEISDLQTLCFFTGYGKQVKTGYNLKEKSQEIDLQNLTSSLCMASKSKLCTT
jgi:hypothetical protein